MSGPVEIRDGLVKVELDYDVGGGSGYMWWKPPTEPMLPATVKEGEMSEPWQAIKEGQVRVVSLTLDGQTCIWDNIKGCTDELELFWSEGEGQEDQVTVRFFQMKKEAVDALPEFTGW